MGDWKKNVMRGITRDWRRTGLLAVLIVVGVVLLIRQLTGATRQAQAGANARPAPTTVSGSNPAVGGQATAQAVQAGASQSVFHFALRPDNLPPVSDRDPFHGDLSCFPPDPNVRVKASAIPEMVPTSQPEEERRRAEAVLIRQEAARLHLQSVLMDSSPRAMIGKDIYREGQQVGLFVLTEINAQSVVLEKDGYEVTLKLE